MCKLFLLDRIIGFNCIQTNDNSEIKKRVIKNKQNTKEKKTKKQNHGILKIYHQTFINESIFHKELINRRAICEYSNHYTNEPVIHQNNIIQSVTPPPNKTVLTKQ